MSRTQRICFQDSQGKVLFCIPDGGFIRLLYGNGERYFSICRYLDEEHAEIDGVIYLVCEYVRRMERNGIVCCPV